MRAAPQHRPADGSAALLRASFVLGVAFSGFFDGILLHQVLQWHHLLSLVPGETYRDLRVQVYADGLFHVAVYLVAALGLWLLWRARPGLAKAGARARVAGGGLLGFGAWNLVDVGVFHWILGIHRIRVNVPHPMLYDLAWFLGLGVAVALLGLWLLRRPGAGAGGRGSGGHGAAGTVAALVLLAMPLASLPPPNAQTLVVFRPGNGPARAINGIVATGGRIVLIDPAGAFAVVSLPERSARVSLYRAGALLVTRSPALAGCLAAVRPV